MLSSSDAKWKCLWYLLIWSFLLTIVSLSEFLQIKNHVAFYMLAAVSVFFLPSITAIYSNTSGRHGAELLRFGLVLCDPVFACITITPVLLLNEVPGIVTEYKCLSHSTDLNSTFLCTRNTSEHTKIEPYKSLVPSSYEMATLQWENNVKFLVVQMSIIMPIILVLLMGRRTRKINFNTYILCFTYWFLTAMEASSLLEIMLLNNKYFYTIFTAEILMVIVMIVVNSYAIVTLCSFITPIRLLDNKKAKNKFDFLYGVFIAIVAILFAEIPLLVTRLQIVWVDTMTLLPGSFYMWFIKDILWLVLIVVFVYVQRFGQKCLTLPCKPTFKDKKLYFQPEKRDASIIKEKYKVQSELKNEVFIFTTPLLSKSCSEPNIQYCEGEIRHLKPPIYNSKSATDLDKVGNFENKRLLKSSIPFSIKFYNDRRLVKKHKPKKRVTFKTDVAKIPKKKI